ncbi:MAG: hypothetical protein U0441_08225 [Polyangiaceae bacterium]
MTSSPSYEEPKQTRPFLIAEASSPDVRQIKVVDLAGQFPLEFSASVMSEDAGEGVTARLVLDYGIAVDQHPYRQPLGDPDTIEAATLDDGPRTLTAKWESSFQTGTGCHYATMFATHKLNFDTGCPVNPDDFSFLTWTVVVCKSTDAPCCDPTAPAEEGGCAALSCPDIDPNVRCAAAPGGSP